MQISLTFISYCFIVEGMIKSKFFQPLDLLISPSKSNDSTALQLCNLPNQAPNRTSSTSDNNCLTFLKSNYDYVTRHPVQH